MLFQQFAQEHSINLKKINVTDHALTRARERFSWSHLQDEQIKGNLRSLLKNARYVGEIYDKENRLSYLFATERRGMYLSSDFKHIKTVILHNEVTYAPLKSKIRELHERRLRGLSRTEKSQLKKLESLKLDCDIDMALLKKRIKRTKSTAVRNACLAKIKAIKQTIEEYENEIKLIQDEKRAVSRSLVAII